MPEVGREAAVAEFERLAAAADVDVDVSNMSQEDADDVVEVRDLVSAAIERGALSVDDKGQAVMATVAGEPITFRVPKGADLMIMASATESKRMEAMVRFVCAITGQDSRRIGGLRKKEWKLALRLAGFLSAD
jgi:hypothetical protein